MVTPAKAATITASMTTPSGRDFMLYVVYFGSIRSGRSWSRTYTPPLENSLDFPLVFYKKLDSSKNGVL